jgi:hypothetical protein
MIEIGYNGIEFGKYTEDEFLSMIPSDLVEFCKLITHRDTQITGDEHWRLQGTINSVDFAVYVLNNPEGLSNITSIKRDGANSINFVITMIIPII